VSAQHKVKQECQYTTETARNCAVVIWQTTILRLRHNFNLLT